jgi:uncharacterized phage-associated protein
MLYIADREFLLERGYLFTGDRVMAMERCPVLSRIFDCIKGKGKYAKLWKEYISVNDKYKLKLVKYPGIGELSKASMNLLQSVFERYGHLKPFEVVKLTHEFPEWQFINKQI